MVLGYSKCSFVIVSTCIHPCMCHQSTHTRSCIKQPFIILYLKDTLQPTDKRRTRLKELNEPAGDQCSTVFSHCVVSSLPLTSLCSPVASPTQTVNTDSDCGGMIGNVNCRKLVSLLVAARVICLQSSLFALPSRGSAGLCRVTSDLESARVYV